MKGGEEAVSRISASIETLWRRNLPRLLERLDSLDVAAACAAVHTSEPALLEEAADTAHKLAGSLGMFGHHEGTDIARKIEVLLHSPDPDAELLIQLMSQLRSSLPLE